MDKVCELCGSGFVDRSTTQHGRFCSSACRHKSYRAAHLDSERNYMLMYRTAHKEELKEHYHNWHKVNMEAQHDRMRNYREENKESIRARTRAWYEANRDDLRTKTKVYRIANRDSVREWNARRRALKIGATVKPVDRKAIYERDNYTCQLCGKKVRMKAKYPHPLSPVLDHILPLSKGGTHEPRNVQLVHNICNNRKWNTGIDQLRLLDE